MAEAPKTLKDAELQKYYDRLFDLHGSAGWGEFIADVEVMEADKNRADTIKDQRELDFRQGQLDILRWVKARQEIVEQAYLHILTEQEGEAEEATGGVAKVVK